ncbi:hypothetical protein SpCBS45565_g05061 [Spizellomyces sp. 'palustris']|nr:hypothetical protein SpCBS45565_g05061 [Spizellomyces sp. 'palustris']
MHGEKWKDIYAIYSIWSRPLTIKSVAYFEVPIIGPQSELPSSLVHASDNHGLTYRLVAGFIAAKEDGKDILLSRKCVTAKDRIVYILKGELWSTTLHGRKFGPDVQIACPRLGPETRLDPAIRSDIYPVAGSDMVKFRRLDDDAIEAVVNECLSEEGHLCGTIYAMNSYDENLMRASLSLIRVPENFPLGNFKTPCESDGEPGIAIPQGEQIVRIDHIDDSLNAVALNESLLAYRTWSGDSVHPIVFLRIHDQSEYATLLLNDMEDNLVLHLLMTRFHVIVVSGAGRAVYVHELASMKRLHTFSLSKLLDKPSNVDWVDVTMDENGLLFGMEDGRLVFLDLHHQKANIYYGMAPCQQEALWLMYRESQIKGGRTVSLEDRVVCKVLREPLVTI